MQCSGLFWRRIAHRPVESELLTARGYAAVQKEWRCSSSLAQCEGDKAHWEHNRNYNLNHNRNCNRNCNHNHNNHNNQAVCPKRALVCVTCGGMDDSGQPMVARASGAAQRRKLRRLRAALRHEQQSIAMVLASALRVQWRFRYPLPLMLRGSVLIRVMWIWFLLRSGLGLDDFLGSLQAHASRSACLFN